jgi:hypothetical protein
VETLTDVRGTLEAQGDGGDLRGKEVMNRELGGAHDGGAPRRARRGSGMSGYEVIIRFDREDLDCLEIMVGLHVSTVH